MIHDASLGAGRKNHKTICQCLIGSEESGERRSMQVRFDFDLWCQTQIRSYLPLMNPLLHGDGHSEDPLFLNSNSNAYHTKPDLA